MTSERREYTALLIAHPDLNEEGISKLKSHFGELVTRQGGTLGQALLLGKRRLHGKIRRLSEGIYLQIKFQFPPEQISTLQKAMPLIESLLRGMIIQEPASLSVHVLPQEQEVRSV